MSKIKSYPMLLEARNILLDHYHLTDDRHIIVDNDMRIQPYGAADGATKIRFFGISRRHRIYTADTGNRRVIYASKKSMQNLGRMVDFQAEPSAAACRVKMYIFYPVVLVFFENKDGDLQLSTFTARTFLSFLAHRMTRKRFEKQMEDFLSEGVVKKEEKIKKEKKKKESSEEGATSEESSKEKKKEKKLKKKKERKSLRQKVYELKYGKDYKSFGDLFQDESGSENEDDFNPEDEERRARERMDEEDDLDMPLPGKAPREPAELRKAPPKRKKKEADE